jgi:GT2 family glycosyltransferase
LAVKATRKFATRAVMSATKRPGARGKSIFLGHDKLHVRGVTYGTFSPEGELGHFPSPATVSRDFAAMAENGINAVRTYSVPPPWLLDLAGQHGLWVMVGLPWEEHVTFLDDRSRTKSIKERVRAGVRACAGHPAVLCYAIGNEIPASIVRWHGRHRIERFLHDLYRATKSEDPDGLVTYVNYPSTEYLQLPFLDLVSFNVFLESGPRFESYLARLQNIAGNRPLLITETGLDSRRHTEEAQARALDWQIRASFAGGCAGVFVFSWTDEWHRGGFDIEDWDFGLVDRGRSPKPALAAARQAFDEVPFPKTLPWPRISVIVCTYNGEGTLRSCLEGLSELRYPNFEVVVVNDGSTDGTDRITEEYDFRLIRTENQGLASARNVGLEAATGEIVAYLDADARPDPDWLTHLAVAFMRSRHSAVGGPNIPPPSDGTVAECVANAPGGPIHVLLSDQEAEHIPGCNMAFLKERLKAIGGFDPQFRIAGDDVDICWRLQNDGQTVGFSPGAVVWHHRRDSVGGYFKQQYEYGKAEALLERKWPDRYNGVGRLAWAGRVYGNGAATAPGWRRWKIYYGTWGTGLFQSVYQRVPGALAAMALVPEWYLLIIALVSLSALGVLWSPLLLAVPVAALAAGALVFEAALGAAQASFSRAHRSSLAELPSRALTGFLHMLQPLARLSGRLRHGLAPRRRRRVSGLALPRTRNRTLWSEHWQSPEQRLQRIEAQLRSEGGTVLRGAEYDRWELQARGGLLGVARLRMAVEEHGGGKQLVRLRSWPKCSGIGIATALLLAGLSLGAALDRAWAACAILGVVAMLLTVWAIRDCATASGILLSALEKEVEEGDAPADLSRNERSQAPAPMPWPTAKEPALPRVRARGEQKRHGHTPVADDQPSVVRVAHPPSMTKRAD